MREATTEFLERQPTLSVQGATDTAEEALEYIEESVPDLILVDTRLPGMDGIEFVRQVTDRWPDVRCIMLSGHDQWTYVERALEAGARGYLAKGSPSEIPKAIERILAGEVYYSDSIDEGPALDSS